MDRMSLPAALAAKAPQFWISFGVKRADQFFPIPVDSLMSARAFSPTAKARHISAAFGEAR